MNMRNLRIHTNTNLYNHPLAHPRPHARFSMFANRKKFIDACGTRRAYSNVSLLYMYVCVFCGMLTVTCINILISATYCELRQPCACYAHPTHSPSAWLACVVISLCLHLTIARSRPAIHR